MLQNVAALIPGSSGLAATVRGRIAVRPVLAGSSALRGSGYPTKFGAALFAGSGALLVVDNSAWPNVVHTAHANDPEEEYLVSNVNDGQCLVVQGPSLVGRATIGTGPAQQILFGGTLHVTGYTLADDQSVLNTNVATLQSQVATLQSTESTDAANIATLQGQNTTLQSQVTTLQGQVVALQQLVSILSATSKVGPLQATLPVASGMLSRPGVLAQSVALLAGHSVMLADLEHAILGAANFAVQPGLTASAGLIANISVRFTPGFYMATAAGGPAFAVPAPLRIASNLTLPGFVLSAQPAVMASVTGMIVGLGNQLSLLPGPMGFVGGFTADATPTKLMAPSILAASSAINWTFIQLQAALAALPVGSNLAATGSLIMQMQQLLPGNSALVVDGWRATWSSALLPASSAVAVDGWRATWANALLTGSSTLAAMAGGAIWQGSAQFAGAGLLTGSAALASSTFDPSNKSANVTLSNNNLTATNVLSPGTTGCVRGVKSHNSGKLYFEMTLGALATLSDRTTVGLCNASFGTIGAVGIGQDTAGNSWGCTADPGSWWIPYRANAELTVGSFASPNVPSVGDVIGVAVDFTAGSIWFSVNGYWLSNRSTTFNSASTVFSFTAGTTLYPACSVCYAGNASQLSFNGGAFVYTPPSGFTAWG